MICIVRNQLLIIKSLFYLQALLFIIIRENIIFISFIRFIASSSQRLCSAKCSVPPILSVLLLIIALLCELSALQQYAAILSIANHLINVARNPATLLLKFALLDYLILIILLPNSLPTIFENTIRAYDWRQELCFCAQHPVLSLVLEFEVLVRTGRALSDLESALANAAVLLGLRLV